MSGEDQRVRTARDTLAGYDRGEWSDALNVVGHLAAAVRMLLEVVDAPGPAGTGVRPDGSAAVAAADVRVLLGALADAAEWTDTGADAARYRSLARSLGDDR